MTDLELNELRDEIATLRIENMRLWDRIRELRAMNDALKSAQPACTPDRMTVARESGCKKK